MSNFEIVQINNADVKFELTNAATFVSSLDVSTTFDKRHDSIIRRIKQIAQDAGDDFTRHNFVVSEYTDESGKTNKAYNLTRDGFVFLVMGFTGKEAARFKIEYINAFNELEQRALANKLRLEGNKYAELERRATRQSLGYKSVLKQQKETLNTKISELENKLYVHLRRSRLAEQKLNELNCHYRDLLKTLHITKEQEQLATYINKLINFKSKDKVAAAANLMNLELKEKTNDLELAMFLLNLDGDYCMEHKERYLALLNALKHFIN